MANRIRMQISGRLGNQLFEWSYAHHLADKFSAVVTPIVDSTHFNNNEISIFRDPVFTCESITTQKRSETTGHLLKVLDKLNSLFQKKNVRIESRLGFFRQNDAYVIEEPNFCPRLVTGFFIDSSHVEMNKTHLFNHLSTKFEKEKIDLKLNSLIGQEKFQAIHIRRGDFIPLKQTFGLLSADWYRSNLDPQLPLIIATDDIEGSSTIVKDLRPHLILNPKDWTPWETLGFLSKAEKLTIANSTFSWWAGFCAIQNGKTCFVPKPFYKSEPWKDKNLSLRGSTYSDSLFEE